MRASDILPSDLMLDPRQVRVGDAILGYADTDQNGSAIELARGKHLVLCYESKVVTCVKDGIWYEENRRRKFYSGLDNDIRLIVRRTEQPHRSIAEFPHRCPRCGTQAYVGLFSIEHEAGGGDCPAPF